MEIISKILHEIFLFMENKDVPLYSKFLGWSIAIGCAVFILLGIFYFIPVVIHQYV